MHDSLVGILGMFGKCPSVPFFVATTPFVTTRRDSYFVMTHEITQRLAERFMTPFADDAKQDQATSQTLQTCDYI